VLFTTKRQAKLLSSSSKNSFPFAFQDYVEYLPSKLKLKPTEMYALNQTLFSEGAEEPVEMHLKRISPHSSTFPIVQAVHKCFEDQCTSFHDFS
jgi:hypothetical protein